MTKEAFRYLIDTRKPLEFSYRNKNYNLTYGKENDGKEYILFGERYMGKKFYSYGEFMNEAKVENSFFREMIEDL